MDTEGRAIAHPTLSRNQPPGPARMHPVADAYLLWRLCKEALRRITGVPRNASFLTTLFAASVLANALRHIAAPSLKALRRTPPSFAGTVMAGAVVREIPEGESASVPRSGAAMGLSGAVDKRDIFTALLLRAVALPRNG